MNLYKMCWNDLTDEQVISVRDWLKEFCDDTIKRNSLAWDMVENGLNIMEILSINIEYAIYETLKDDNMCEEDTVFEYLHNCNRELIKGLKIYNEYRNLFREVKKNVLLESEEDE